MSWLSGSDEQAGTHGGMLAAVREDRRSLCGSLLVDQAFSDPGE